MLGHEGSVLVTILAVWWCEWKWARDLTNAMGRFEVGGATAPVFRTIVAKSCPFDPTTLSSKPKPERSRQVAISKLPIAIYRGHP
jgi:hypothetical protein